jgi:Tol biopolymer transport system component
MRRVVRVLVSLIAPAVAACSESSAPNGEELVPALEAVPYSLLGTGKIAFKRFTDQYDAVYVIDLSAQKTSAVLRYAASDGPVLSPDGTSIATKLPLPGSRLIYPEWDVFVGSSAGTGFRSVTSLPPSIPRISIGPPTWTPDGQRVMMERTGDSHAALLSEVRVSDGVELRTIPMGGENLCPSAFLYLPDERVAIAPDGRIAYACQDVGIIVLSPEGHRIATYGVPAGPAIIGGLAWSPDGTQIATVEWSVSDARRAEFSLRLVKTDGSPPITIVHKVLPASAGNPYSGGNAEAVCWLNGVNRLLFTLPEDIALYTKLWVVNPDGTGLTQITTRPLSTDRSISCVP